eukprot:5683666-Prymnesium_polylepis.2
MGWRACDSSPSSSLSICSLCSSARSGVSRWRTCAGLGHRLGRTTVALVGQRVAQGGGPCGGVAVWWWRGALAPGSGG